MAAPDESPSCLQDRARNRARREPPAVRRQDLLDVTVSCLARLGPKATTGREICRRAGVSHGLLRHYFSNPDQLLLETYQQLCDDFLARFEEELTPERGDEPWSMLDRFFVLLFSERWASADLLGAWIAFWHLVRQNDEFRAVSKAFNTRLRALLASCAARLDSQRDAASLADGVTMLAAVMDGLWLDFCLASEGESRERAAALCSKAARRLLPA